ncbi:MAG: hypothetical protein RIQ71_1151 [Verrucomicrobiota bacterium]|jgi:glycosyltransferase involved in cell wall biosynthesis
MKPLRIAILAPTFLPKCSGAEVFHHNLAAHLVAAGHAVTVVLPRSKMRQLREKGWRLPYDLEIYPDKRWNWLKKNARFAFWLNRRALTSLQRKYSFDVWHAFVLYPAGVVLADWQRVTAVPGLVRAVGDDVSGLPLHRHESHVAVALREKLPHAGALVALSEEMAGELRTLGIPREKIRILPNAVDAERFAASPAVRSSVRSDLGIPGHAFVFLCVARNHPQKDFATLFEAFRRLCQALPDNDLRLVVAGRGAQGLRGQVADLAERVQLHEFEAGLTGNTVPELPPQKLVDLYAASDAFVLSSLLEGFSSAVIEAMAAGLPVVATDAPGIRGVVTNRQEGLLVPLRSPESLADAMRTVVEDSSLRNRLSSNSRSTAERYNWPSVVAAYESFYRDLAADRRRT